MKPNRQEAKFSRRDFTRTSEIFSLFAHGSVPMALLQTGSIEQAQSVVTQHIRQYQCHLISNQIQKINKSFQVNNAVR